MKSFCPTCKKSFCPTCKKLRLLGKCDSASSNHCFDCHNKDHNCGFLAYENQWIRSPKRPRVSIIRFGFEELQHQWEIMGSAKLATMYGVTPWTICAWRSKGGIPFEFVDLFYDVQEMINQYLECHAIDADDQQTRDKVIARRPCMFRNLHSEDKLV